jgi:hypothetical protein
LVRRKRGFETRWGHHTHMAQPMTQQSDRFVISQKHDTSATAAKLAQRENLKKYGGGHAPIHRNAMRVVEFFERESGRCVIVMEDPSGRQITLSATDWNDAIVQVDLAKQGLIAAASNAGPILPVTEFEQGLMASNLDTDP